MGCDVRDEVLRCLPRIEKIAKKVAMRLPVRVEVEDLVSAGVVGLLEVVDHYDPSRAERFEAFMEKRVRGAMLDHMRQVDTLSRDSRKLAHKLRKATRQLEAQLCRHPEQEEIAKHLGLSLEEFYEWQQKLSGHEVVGLADIGPAFLEHVADQAAPDPFEYVAQKELRALVDAAIDHLPPRLCSAMTMLYRMGMDQDAVGRALGVSASRVCQLSREATQQLQRCVGNFSA